jgi:glucose/mannose transport system substrate-binding protein
MTGSDGKYYGVPLKIERDNTLFFNRKVLADAALSPPTTIANWFEVADALKAKGVAPLAVSASGGWTIAGQFFEGLLVSEAGPQFYRDYLSGAQAPDAPEIQQTLADLAKMMDYANDDRAMVGWGEAVKRVCTGEAAMVFLPDFVSKEFQNQGCGPDSIGYVPLQPVAAPSFVHAPLGYAVPLDAPHRETALEFLKVVGSRNGQTAFATVRGGLTARTDLDPARFDALTRQTMADYASQATVKKGGYAILATNAFQVEVNPGLQQFVDPASPDFGNVTTMVDLLRRAYVTLQP